LLNAPKSALYIALSMLPPQSRPDSLPWLAPLLQYMGQKLLSDYNQEECIKRCEAK